MYFESMITGASLPQGVLCLTFDDGPGTHTRAVAAYLNELGIPASFFVVGQCVAQGASVLRELHQCGHLLGNHSWSHKSFRSGATNTDEITRTNEALREFVDPAPTYFRPPYGEWSGEIARALNNTLPAALGSVGPIGWDIDGRDWESWAARRSPQEAADLYLAKIETLGRGIVLLHDACAEGTVAPQDHRTLELTQLLVPELLERGYQFCRLDDIPLVDFAARLPLQGHLQNSAGELLHFNAVGQIIPSSESMAPWTFYYRGDGRAALQAPCGGYLASRADDSLWLAQSAAPCSTYRIETSAHDPRRVAFRAASGRYLRWIDPAISLMENGHPPSMESFFFTHVPPRADSSTLPPRS